MTGDSDADEPLPLRPDSATVCIARVAYSAGPSGEHNILSALPDGSDIRTVTEGADDSDPQWSPDGSRILFDRLRGGQLDLYSAAPDGSDVRNLTPTQEAERLARWSPDGRKIAFERDGYLWIASSDGTLAVQLDAPSLAFALYGSTLEWAPDGQHIAIVSGQPSELYVVPVDGRMSRNITNTPDVAENRPAWSPDGARLAFARANDIWVASADGSGAINLTPNSPQHADSTPLWTRDGSILFASDRDSAAFKLYVVPATGGAIRRVSDHRLPPSGSHGDFLPILAPDGERVAFTRFSDEGNASVVATVGLDGANPASFGANAVAGSWSPCAASAP